MDVFGSRWSGFMTKLDNGWHDTITDDDTVVIPGDISWAINFDEVTDDLWYLDDLPGKKIISRGNHDYWWDTVTKLTAFFDKSEIKTIKLLFNNAYTVDNKIIVGTRGWYPDNKNAPVDADYTKIVAREAGRFKLSIEAGLKLDGAADKHMLAFFHFPPVYRDYVCREFVTLMHEYNIDRCYYGHIHGVYDMPPCRVFEGIEFIPVSADYLNFKPLIID
jgi:Predicted phosphohydrolase